MAEKLEEGKSLEKEVKALQVRMKDMEELLEELIRKAGFKRKE